MRTDATDNYPFTNCKEDTKKRGIQYDQLKVKYCLSLLIALESISIDYPIHFIRQ